MKLSGRASMSYVATQSLVLSNVLPFYATCCVIKEARDMPVTWPQPRDIRQVSIHRISAATSEFLGDDPHVVKLDSCNTFHRVRCLESAPSAHFPRYWKMASRNPYLPPTNPSFPISYIVQWTHTDWFKTMRDRLNLSIFQRQTQWHWKFPAKKITRCQTLVKMSCLTIL